jgi:hypothetical protein
LPFWRIFPRSPWWILKTVPPILTLNLYNSYNNTRPGINLLYYSRNGRVRNCRV